MRLPPVFWTGLATALFMLAAVLVVSLKGRIKAKVKFKLHRGLAWVALVFALIHLYLALRIYF